MGANLIRVRVRLERPAEFWGLSISVVAHLAAFALMLGLFSCGPPTPLPGPSMAVTLTGASIAAKSSSRAQAPRETPRVDPKPQVQKPRVQDRPQEPSAKPPPRPQRSSPSNEPTRAVEPRREPAPHPETAVPHPPATEPNEELDLPEGPIAGGVAGLDSISSLSPGYAGSVAQRLQGAWIDRPVLPHGAPAQRTVMRFRILRDGRIEAIELSQPSDYALLNQSVLRLLRSVGRLPAFPPSIKRDSIDAEFVFELLPAEP